jgi:hypothetical protein
VTEGRGSRLDALAVGAAAALLCAPFFRFVARLGDEGILLNAAQRMVSGEALYRDFFEFLFPLGFMATAGWMRCFGTGLPSARSLAIAIIALTAMFSYAASVRVSRSRSFSAGVVLVWLFTALYRGRLMGTHHRWFAALFLSAAVVLALDALGAPRAPRRWGAIGLAIGAGTLTTPTSGALLGLACVIVLLAYRRPLVELLSLFAGNLVALALVVIYLGAHHSIDGALSGLAFLAKDYAGVQGVRFARGVDRHNWPLALFFPAALLLSAIALFQGRLARKDPRLGAVAAFGLAGWAMCFPRPTPPHIVWAIPFVCPLLALGLHRVFAPVFESPRARWVGAALALAIALGPTIGYVKSVALAAKSPEAETARGRVRLGPDTNPAQLRRLLDRIRVLPSERGFFYPYDAMVIYLSGRRHVAPVYYFTPEFTLPSQYRSSCQIVLREAAWVVLDRLNMDAGTILGMWPAIGVVNPPERLAFERAVEGAFEPVVATPRYELRMRRSDAEPAACAAIPAEP